METILQFIQNSLLPALGPVVVGLLTVPAFDALKRASAAIDGLQPFIKRLLVVIVAVVLNAMGQLLDVVLPEALELFTETDVAALLSAAIAFAAKAGNQAIETRTRVLGG